MTASSREPDPVVAPTPSLFAEWRAPRFGSANPERLENPVWEWLIHSEHSAYAASQHFGLAANECREPGWSFARFGQSTTTLPDGRVVLIAGEHEDSYDRDFYIYNDVVVRRPDGEIEIYGYPRDVFPPTDFHTATLSGNRIVIVGSLGYPADREPGRTQVVVLDLATFEISLVATSGDAPGWIHNHTATLADVGRAIVIGRGLIETGRGARAEFQENGDDWRLDLESWRWERLTTRKWRQWQLDRADRRPNHLWQVSSLAQFRGVRWAAAHRDEMEAMVREQADSLRATYGADPDLDVYAALYVPPVAHEAVVAAEPEFGVRRIRVDGVVVRYVEGPMSVKLIIEGQVPDKTAAALVDDLRHKLSTIERTNYEAREM
jgi:hypothetical protein